MAVEDVTPLPFPRGTIIDDPVEVASWLSREMGLSIDAFDEVTERARLEWATHTEYDPPSFPGTIFWGMCVRFLRTILVRLGWAQDDSGNFSRIIHPDGTKAIVVETGDENTGIRGPDQPRTKSPKGAQASAAIMANIDQLDFFLDPAQQLARAAGRGRQMLTYLLLVRLDGWRVYRELSLPVRFDGTERIDSWHIRVILPAFGGGEPPLLRVPLPEPGPEPTIEVTRRSA